MTAKDPLYAPLGVEPDRPRRARRVSAVSLLALAVVLAAGAAGIYFARTAPRTGDAVVVSSIEVARPEVAPARPPAPPAPAATPPPIQAPTAGLPAGSTVEVQNGVKIVRLNPAASASPVTVPVGAEATSPLAPAPDARVSETAPEGTLPRIGRDGSRPSVVYARPTPKADGPRVALVALGVGRDQLGSAEAARLLPLAIDFALPPDAPDARQQVAEIRRGGREVVLDLGEGRGADRSALRKAMAAWSGYVGMKVPAGGEDAAREARERGLIPLQAPGADGGADLVADAGDPAGLSGAMARLGQIASAKGLAVGVIENAIPGRDALAQAAAGLAAQGISLVPVSAGLAGSSAAAAR